MSYAKLNIWIRYADCRLITSCWRTDLVIKTCCDEPLVDMDPTVFEMLKERYQDFQEVSLHDYAGERRIKFYPGRGKYVYHLEVDVPPGCYVVWTRVCYNKNEETNKVMVNVGCGEEACVNLLLDAVETCGKEIFHPLLERGIELGIPRRELNVVAGVLAEVADIPIRDLVAELGQRHNDAEEKGDPKLQEKIGMIMEMVKPLRRRRGQEVEED